MWGTTAIRGDGCHETGSLLALRATAWVLSQGFDSVSSLCNSTAFYIVSLPILTRKISTLVSSRKGISSCRLPFITEP